MKMKEKILLYRYLLFLIGLFIASMGVAFSTKAGLGTSPVASVPYSVSLVSDALTFGGWLNLLSLIQIIIQVILIKGITANTYLLQFAFMAAGCFILALGIWIQLKGAVAMLPGEAMNRAISMVTGLKYENIKIFFDILYIRISAGICLLFLGKLAGVREGSIIAAVAVGNIIKIYEKIYARLTDTKLSLHEHKLGKEIR